MTLTSQTRLRTEYIRREREGSKKDRERPRTSENQVTVFFIDSETNEIFPLHFQNVFHFFSEKNSLIKTFPVECVRSSASSCNKRWEVWCETHTPLWLLIGRIIFLTCEKTSFAILIGRIIFFTCENHRSLL